MLGTWAIGGKNWGNYSEKDAVEALKTAFDEGIRGIDTSPVYGYGHAEELVGRILGGSRSDFFLATKGGLDREAYFAKNLSPSFLEKDLHGSLKRLKTDYIDLYQCHWPDEKTPLEETMQALQRFKEEGKILNIGLCNFPLEKIKEAMNLSEIFSLQDRLSLLEQSKKDEIFSFAGKNKLHGLVYGTIEGGLLTGKYTAPPRFGKKDVRSYFYANFNREVWPRVKGLLSVMEKIAEVYNVRPGVIAVAWALSIQGVSSAIIGARSTLQVRENLEALEITLSADDLQLLEIASK